MSNYINLDPCPVNEYCEKVGNPNYHSLAIVQCERWKKQLEKHFDPIPDGVWLKVKEFPHDFGSYYEVVAYYLEERDEEGNNPNEDFVVNMQDNLPLKWED